MPGADSTHRPAADPHDGQDAPKAKPAPWARGAVRFRAELDLAELDERKRPGGTWTGRAVELSRSELVLRSRRMCYAGRQVLVAVHLVDDQPVPLFGIVKACEYDGDGMYRTILSLAEMPDDEAVRTWAADHARGRM